MEFLLSIILLWQFLLFSTNNIWWTNTTKTIFLLIFTIITTIADSKTFFVELFSGLKAREFIHTLGNAHLYTNRIDPLKVQLDHQLTPFPPSSLNGRWATSRTLPRTTSISRTSAISTVMAFWKYGPSIEDLKLQWDHIFLNFHCSPLL